MTLTYIVWTVVLLVIAAGAYWMQRNATRELDEAIKALDRAIALREDHIKQLKAEREAA